MLITSDEISSSSIEMSCFANRTVMPNAGALAATARPIRPRPMIPSCLPRSSVPSMKSIVQPFQPPRRTSRSPSPIRRAAVRIRRPGQLRRRLGEDVRGVRDDHATRLRRRGTSMLS